MNPLVEREDGVADGGVVGQTEVFLRWTRGRGGMTVPISENLQTFAACVFQSSKLVLGGERKVFWRVVDILHPVVLRHHVALQAASTQQVTARLIRCVLPGLSYQFINNGLWNLHLLKVKGQKSKAFDV